jgi:hypothetical protein
MWRNVINHARKTLKRNLFAALGALLPVAVVLGAGIADADAQQTCRRWSRSYRPAERLTPTPKRTAFALG